MDPQTILTTFDVINMCDNMSKL